MFRKNHFTLIEMLVVIAIIGVLASLMLPSLQSALESSRLTSCTNSKRQVYYAFMRYAEDYRYLPPVDSGAPVFAHWYTGYYVGRYLEEPPDTSFNSAPRGWLLYKCPSYDGERLYYFGSGYNYCSANWINRINGGSGILPFVAFRSPSKVALLVDTEVTYFWNTFAVGSAMGTGPAYRHGGLCPVLMAAGNCINSYDLGVDKVAKVLTEKAGP